MFQHRIARFHFTLYFVMCAKLKKIQFQLIHKCRQIKIQARVKGWGCHHPPPTERLFPYQQQATGAYCAHQKKSRQVGAIYKSSAFRNHGRGGRGEFNYLSKQPAPTNNETLFDFYAAAAAADSAAAGI
jgi:hypothetical protein